MKRIDEALIYQGRVITLRKDTVRMIDGQVFEREVVAHPGAVVVIAVLGEELLFVRQYRYAANESLLELVAGTLEPGEDPYDTADRELQEEVGFKAGRLTKLGEFFSAPGFCTELLHLYLAEELSPSQLPCDDDEAITVERFTLPAALAMVSAGHLRDAKSLAGLLFYMQYVQQG
jgi:ADP-ribose pyrophosphatase